MFVFLLIQQRPSGLYRAVIAAFLGVVFSSITHAQPWWVVPIGEENANEEAVESLRTALSAQGVTTHSIDEMQEIFERDVSMPASSLSQNEIDEWIARSRSAVRNLARADYDAARADLLNAQELSEQAAEELNREATRARQVLDTCLYMVRAFIETQDWQRADTQARQCRRLVPQVEPSEFRHTPEVRELLERLDRQSENEPPGRLRVQSQPSGCLVRLNGIQFGQTPFAMDDLTQGDYRLQVECAAEQRGRVHRIRLGEGVTHRMIDTNFDREVESQPMVWIKNRQRGYEHGQRLAQLVEATVVLIHRQGAAWIVSRVSTDDVQSNRPSLQGSLDEVSRALSGRPEQEVVEDEVLVAQTLPPSSSRGLRLGLGIPLLTLGVGALALDIVLHRERKKRGDHYALAQPMDVDFLHRQSRWRNLRAPVYLLAVGGGLLSSAALPFLLPEHDSTPWWAWTMGGLGVVTAALSVVLLARLERCGQIAVDRQQCVDHEQSATRMVMLASFSLPMLTVPLTYLFRSRRSMVRPSVVTLRGGGAFLLEGSF